MAYMIPSSLDNITYTTAGERKLFDILDRSLDSDCIVRYEMLVAMRDRFLRPDYCIIDPHRGVLIIEVKDWGIEGILHANKDNFTVKGYQGSPLPVMKPNPEYTARAYNGVACEQLMAMTSLRSEKGSLLIPVDYFVAFPNISQSEFKSKGFDRILDIEHVLLREDLSQSGDGFIARYQSLMKPLEKPMDDRQIKDITISLFPDITIPRVTDNGFIPASDDVVLDNNSITQTFSLSKEQEQIAKSLKEGPRLLWGIAGTGKTLIMLYRAKLNAANYPNTKTLILCWNIALANYMRQAYAKFLFDAEGEVQIYHFSEFIRLFLNRSVDLGANDDWVYQSLLKRTVSESDKYDAIYIDEAQDFRKEWIEYLFNHLVKGEGKERNFIIAGDEAQRIYANRIFDWKSLGIPMSGRSKILRTIYRNSAKVWTFSAFLLKEQASYARSKDAEKLSFAQKGGWDPQLVECANLSEQINKTVDIIKKVIKNNYSARNVLVLYVNKNSYVRGSRDGLVGTLLKRMTENDIPYDWIAEDAEAKKTFDWSKDTVKVSTVQSAKGMDSPIVIVLGAETFQAEKSDGTDDLKTMYVAMTRAQEVLYVLYSGNRGLVPNLLECQRQYLAYKPGIVSLGSKT